MGNNWSQSSPLTPVATVKLHYYVLFVYHRVKRLLRLAVLCLNLWLFAKAVFIHVFIVSCLTVLLFLVMRP